MPNTDLEYLKENYRQLSSAEHSLLQEQVVERAKALRAEFLREMWRQILAWYEARKAAARLRALDDAALKDIGLHRSGIDAAVAKSRPVSRPAKRPAFPEKPHLCLHRTSAAI